MQLAYLPDRKREYIIDDDAGSYVSELSAEARDDITNLDELVKDCKKSRRRGMLGWFKMRVRSYTDCPVDLKMGLIFLWWLSKRRDLVFYLMRVAPTDHYSL